VAEQTKALAAMQQTRVRFLGHRRHFSLGKARCPENKCCRPQPTGAQSKILPNTTHMCKIPYYYKLHYPQSANGHSRRALKINKKSIIIPTKIFYESMTCYIIMSFTGLKYVISVQCKLQRIYICVLIIY